MATLWLFVAVQAVLLISVRGLRLLQNEVQNIQITIIHIKTIIKCAEIIDFHSPRGTNGIFFHIKTI